MVSEAAVCGLNDVAVSKAGTEESVCTGPPSLATLLPGTSSPWSPSPEGPRGGLGGLAIPQSPVLLPLPHTRGPQT